MVDEQNLSAYFHLGDETSLGEFVEVSGGGDTFGDAGLLDKLDLAVGADEEQFDQLFRGAAGKLVFAAPDEVVQQGTDGADLL